MSQYWVSHITSFLIVMGGGAVFPVYSQTAQSGACLPIDHVHVRGVASLSSEAVAAAVAPFENQCLGLEAFNSAMEAVTTLYIDAGLITSRVYLPEQDLTDRVLELAAIEGTVEAVEFNGEARPLWERFTFPGMRDAVADLREIEQGLDNIRTMPSYSQAEMVLDPGSEAGTSVLQVSARPDPKPWRLSFSTDNFGFEDAGEFNPSIALAWDNVFGINDVWDFSYTSAIDQTPFAIGEPGDSSQQAVIGVTVPYGKWAYRLDQSWSGYTTTIPGAISDIPGRGYSFDTGVAAKRLLHRDEVSKTHLALDLRRSESENFIAGVKIKNSSRVVTSVGAELSHQRVFWDGQLSGRARVEQGVKLLGAEDADAQPEGQPDAQYTLLILAGDYARSWDINVPKPAQMAWVSTAELQLSDDRLYGDQQFILGGNSTIRGSKISLAQGSSGAFWRNEFEYFIPELSPSPRLEKWFGVPGLYVALEAGAVFEQPSLDVLGGRAVGGIAGLRTHGGRLTFDIGYAQLLRVSNGLQNPYGNIRAAMSAAF